MIVGNPPYPGHSKNRGAWITGAIDGYKFTIEQDDAGREVSTPLGERNPKWLDDDYVKFIRFAQLKMDAVQEGVVGVITNHSWLDNPTFRGIRQSLMRSFQQIHVLDLHGNAKKKEKAPDGSKDENVFDIEQGVAVSLFAKRPGLERCIWRGDFWGKRLEKYKMAADGTLKSVNFDAIKPTAPQYLFLRQNAELSVEYARNVPVPGILSVNSVGVVTSRDRLAIHFTREGLLRAVRDFVPATRRREGVYSRQGVGLEGCRGAGRCSGKWASDDCAVPILYRPFDTRWTYYTGKSNGFLVRPRPSTMRNMLSEDNLGVIITRGTKDKDTVFCTSVSAAHKSASVYDISYLFPLYIRAGHDEQGENVSPEFRSFLGARYGHHYAPEEILGYIYAVLYAPTYRARYAEFLRVDFPRVPFPEAVKDFEVLSGLGWALIQARISAASCRGVAGCLSR